jgi:serine/threonine-protein kinase
MHKVLNTEAPPPSALSVSVNPALDAVVAQAMAKRPEARFASARDFAAALRATEAPVDDDATMIRPAAVRPDPATQAVAVEPRRSRVGLIAGGVGALVVAGIVGFVVLGGHAKPPVAAPHPPTTAATTPPAPAPKAVASPPALDPAQLRDRVIAVAASASCALVHGTIDADGGSLTGLVRADQQGRFAQALAAAVEGGSAAPHIQVDLRDFTGPYCGMIGAIKPFAPVFAPPGQRLALHLQGHATRLVTNQHIVVELGLPVWARYAEVDYISSSGATYRLYPTTTSAPALTGGSTLVLGKPPGPAWAVGKPYGTDMIVAIASSAPIDTMPATQAATVTTLAPAAATTLTELKANGAKLATAALLVDTVKAP